MEISALDQGPIDPVVTITDENGLPRHFPTDGEGLGALTTRLASFTTRPPLR